MTYHTFAVDQIVTAHALGAPEGPYRIVRLSPSVNSSPQYRVKSIVDDHERTLRESALKAVEPPVPKALKPTKPLAQTERSSIFAHECGQICSVYELLCGADRCTS